MYIIGLDVGGTKIEAVLVKDDTKKFSTSEPIIKKRIPTESEKGYEFILQKITDLVFELSSGINENFAVGMGIPGVVDPITKITRWSNIKNFEGKSLQKDLAEIIKMPVFVENDANCFVLSEASFGAAQDVDLVLGIILGTGVGGGIVYQKKIISGSKGYAGEIGHVSFDTENGEKCWCGNRGCPEAYLSGRGMESMFFKKYHQRKSVPEIYKLYLSQDKNAMEFIDYFLDIFGKVIANLIYTIAPHKIVLGGGVSNIPLLYTEGVKKVAQNIHTKTALPEIVKSKLGDSSGVFGAVSLALSA